VFKQMRKLLPLLLILSGAAVASAQDDTLCTNCPPPTEDPSLPAVEILQYPAPNVVQLAPAEDLLYDRLYMRITGAASIFDAPGGAQTSVLDPGFNFVTVQGSFEDWLQINDGQWLTGVTVTQVLPSTFAGVLLPSEGLPYPMGWTLMNRIPSREPGVEPVETDVPFMRYTPINLYTATQVGGATWYQVGQAQWLHQHDVAKVIPVSRPEGVVTQRWVSVDLYEQVAIAYEGDVPVFATLVSSGLAEWPTNEGVFEVYVRYARTVMSGAYGAPDFYYLEEVPWTMYFDNDIALHGTYWHDGFGYRHSHGCVNLSITDANWLFEWASPEFDFTVPGDTGIGVFVYSSGQYT